MKTNTINTRRLTVACLFAITLCFCFYSHPAAAKNYSMYSNDSDGDGVRDKKDKCPNTPKGVGVTPEGCPLDGDKDGVADYLDKCPKEVGGKNMNGCPDKDKDGVADIDDGCPDVPGTERFKGCPDTDGDGIEDSKDKCPNAKGSDQFKGCPDTDGDGVDDSNDKCTDTEKGIKVDSKGCALDTDGDGIIDSKDKCPTSKAEGTANGCPEIKVVVIKRLQTIAQQINFETGKATLKPSSFPVLDELAKIMAEYVDYNLKMGGHTDNVGNDDANFKLSQARMDAVKSYLVTKGVALGRIEATGYGETKPVASNDKADGRMQNRRVELELVVR